MTDGRRVFFGVQIIIFKLSDRNSKLFQAMLNGVLWSQQYVRGAVTPAFCFKYAVTWAKREGLSEHLIFVSLKRILFEVVVRGPL
jgi:hypothetical protein